MDTSSILVLDDHPETCELIQHFCADRWPVDCHTTCAEARTVLCTRVFDLLVLDLRLHDGSGCNVLHFARHHTASRNKDTPAVAITATVRPGQREALISKGFDGYLSKPFQRADLLALFRTHLPDSCTP